MAKVVTLWYQDQQKMALEVKTGTKFTHYVVNTHTGIRLVRLKNPSLCPDSREYNVLNAAQSLLSFNKERTKAATTALENVVREAQASLALATNTARW